MSAARKSPHPGSASSTPKNSTLSHGHSTGSTGIPRRSTFSPGDNRSQAPSEKPRTTNGQEIRR